MLWEMYQNRSIHNARVKANSAESKAESSAHAVQRLEGKLDALALTCQALWEILRDRTNLTEEELIDKMTEIDIRDGKQDGRMGNGTTPCPRCNRILNRRRDQCMYCGEPVAKPHVFQH